MDVLQLRLWFMSVKQSYIKSVKVVKVDSKGKKFLRTIKITDDVRMRKRQLTKALAVPLPLAHSLETSTSLPFGSHKEGASWVRF